MTRLTGRALEYDIANTIIDDSEPERAAEAAREKKVQQARKKQKQKQDENLTASFTRDITTVISSTGYTDQFEGCVTTPSSKPVSDDLSVILPPIHMIVHDRPPHDIEESNFKRFITRYTLSQPSSSKRPSSNSDPFAKTDIRDKTKEVSKSSSFCLTSLPKAQYVKLNKCYVCNLVWTTRKTIPKKLTHIQSCAKKHGWTEETLISVFHKELHDADLPEESNPLPDSVTLPSHGFLEDLTDTTTAYKKQLKGRPKQNNILDPTQAHSAIVERVKSLFDSNQHPEIPYEPADGFPSTQVFPPSKLNSAARGLFARAMREENEKRDIPPTQKLASLSDNSLNPVTYPNPIFYQFIPSSRLTSNDIPVTWNSESADCLTITKGVIDNVDRRLQSIQPGVTADGLQHYLNQNSPTPPSQLTTVSFPYETTQDFKLPSTTIHASKKINLSEDSGDIDERLRQIIKRNDILYERILRYEPLDIDVFLNLTGIKEMTNEKGFKNDFRAFLDKHCISFYTESALELNRKRW